MNFHAFFISFFSRLHTRLFKRYRIYYLGLPRVELTRRTTLYWRRQHHSPNTYLATVEALYCFIRQFHELCIGKYDKRYDNLLYFFKFFYTMVHKHKAKKTK